MSANSKNCILRILPWTLVAIVLLVASGCDSGSAEDDAFGIEVISIEQGAAYDEEPTLEFDVINRSGGVLHQIVVRAYLFANEERVGHGLGVLKTVFDEGQSRTISVDIFDVSSHEMYFCYAYTIDLLRLYGEQGYLKNTRSFKGTCD